MGHAIAVVTMRQQMAQQVVSLTVLACAMQATMPVAIYATNVVMASTNPRKETKHAQAAVMAAPREALQVVLQLVLACVL